ncbi:MAG: hypothetical protein PHV11_10005, partial [Candidatus Bipolaricaulis sp.]|nr:hypothetical protein [Candidatus Bipolaricaulis sp.]
MDEYEKLFDKWGDLGEKVYSLQGIVQNPVEIPEEQIKEWRDIAAKLWLEFRDLTEVTLHELRKNKTYDVYVHPESDSVWYQEYVEGNQYKQQDPLVEKILKKEKFLLE